MHFEYTVDIAATPARVWAVMTNVERWPEWTASVRRVQRLDNGVFRLGSRARIQQPKLPAMLWTVAALDPGVSFTWEATRPGLRTAGAHSAQPLPDGGTRVTLAVDYRGLLAPLFGRLLGGMTRRYLELEGQGLKRRSESR